MQQFFVEAKVTLLLELKTVDFYFYILLFFYLFRLRVKSNMILHMTWCHTLVTVTQSYGTQKNIERFGSNSIISHVNKMMDFNFILFSFLFLFSFELFYIFYF